MLSSRTSAGNDRSVPQDRLELLEAARHQRAEIRHRAAREDEGQDREPALEIRLGDGRPVLVDQRQRRERVPFAEANDAGPSRGFQYRLAVSGHGNAVNPAPLRRHPQREAHAVAGGQRPSPIPDLQIHGHRRHVAGDRVVADADPPVVRSGHDDARASVPRGLSRWR